MNLNVMSLNNRKDNSNTLADYKNWRVANSSGVMKIKDNSGKRYNATSYFGQGVYLDGISQNIAYTVASTNTEVSMLWNGRNTITSHMYNLWTIGSSLAYYDTNVVVYYVTIDFVAGRNYCITCTPNTIKVYENGILINTINVVAGLLTSSNRTLGNRTGSNWGLGLLKDVYHFNRVLSDAEIMNAYLYPNEFFSSALLDSSCVTAMPLCEKDGFVRNYKTYTEEVNFTGIILSAGTSGAGNTAVKNANVFTLTNTISTGFIYFPLVRFIPTVYTTDLYYIEITVKCLTGTMKATSIECNPAKTINEVLTAGTIKKYSTVAKFVDVGGNRGIITFDGLNYPTFTAEVTVNYTKKILNGIYPITNYTTACRTSAQRLTAGLQTSGFKRDNLGAILSKSNYLECDGVGYANTGYLFSTLPSNETMEVILEKSPITTITYQKFVSGGGDSGVMVIENNLSSADVGTIRYRSGNPGLTAGFGGSDWVNNKIHITIVCDSINVFVYFNGVYKATWAAGNYVNSHIPIKLSVDHAGTNDVPNGGALRLFKVHKKALTASQVLANYNKYVAKGLLA